MSAVRDQVMFITIDDERGGERCGLAEAVREAQKGRARRPHGGDQRRGSNAEAAASNPVRSTFSIFPEACQVWPTWDIDFKLPTGRGDEFAHGGAGGGDARDRPKSMPEAREIYVRDLHIDTLKVNARNFH